MSNKTRKTQFILAIETSCDETSAAVVFTEAQKIKPLGSIITSQIEIHAKTNGVVPEVAARAHIQNIQSAVSGALRKAGIELSEIDYIAVTRGPGLITSLMVGVEFAKGLSIATGKPIIPVNHMLGHLHSVFVDNPQVALPSINLIVSGKHTDIVLLKTLKDYKVLGSTVDDAAGEAFDKVARMLMLPYPGGPQISRAAAGAEHDFNFPRPMIHEKNYNFSFAGLKTAVLYKIRDERLDVRNAQVKADIACSFEDAVVEVLVKKTARAAEEFKAKSITLSGGVAANKKLRETLATEAKRIGREFYVPDFSLCTDNALMIANAAAIMLRNGFKPVGIQNLKADPNWEL